MATNVFACLVHESPECVLDLVRNLRALDPSSPILLYNGGPDPRLLDSPALLRTGGIPVPQPRRMTWGRLHDFALDCMRFALAEMSFDFFTIVDSDQLALRSGYSEFLASHFGQRDRLGMLGSATQRQTEASPIAPVRTMFEEFELWRPFLQHFPKGEDHFLYWTFWPSTVFTSQAARALTEFVEHDTQLEHLLAQSKAWATEEVLLPTLVALLGLEIDRNPSLGHYVQYRRTFSVHDLEAAFRTDTAFWMHPVPRSYDNPLRSRIRARHREYRISGQAVQHSASIPQPRLLRPKQILRSMAAIEGWLEEAEGELLLSAALAALSSAHEPCHLVEIGSYCGRSTSVLASVVKATSPESRVWAVDPHEGLVGALDRGLTTGSPTLDRFHANLESLGVRDVVETVRQKSFEVTWDKPIHLLMIDGLHDFVNVSRDFFHFEPWLVEGGFILFHDYADYYPGVMAFVDELLSGSGYRRIELAHTLMLVQRVGTTEQPVALEAPAIRTTSARPLVSCIMPTADRGHLIGQALQYFQRQDYPDLELIILDDGAQSVQGLIPPDARIRYERLPERRSMGHKHNMACRMARGEIICHWDDDDWMAPWRVSYQVEDLLAAPQDALCGLSVLLFYDPMSRRAWRYVYPSDARAWVSGGTFCYRKRFWETYQFPDMNEGADTRYVWGLPGTRIVAHRDPTFYVATVHNRNTSPRRLGDGRYQPLPVEQVEQLLGQDLSFYRNWPAAV